AWGRLIEATPLVVSTEYPFLTKIYNHVAHPLSAIIQLKPEKLAHPDVVPTAKATCVSLTVPRESIVTLVTASLELLSNDAPPSSAAALEQNEEWINAIVDTANEEIGNVSFEKSVEVFVQGVAHPVSEDVNQGVLSGSSVVVVALSAREK
ncbi:hypothetical protein Tco_0945512, partial [Tanacetum coccineum]